MTALYGPAGDLVVLLLWVYYATQMVFFGVEFTRVYANECGTRVEPSSFAEFVSVETDPRPRRATDVVVIPARPAMETQADAPNSKPSSPGTVWWAALGLALGVLWSWRRRE